MKRNVRRDLAFYASFIAALFSGVVANFLIEHLILKFEVGELVNNIIIIVGSIAYFLLTYTVGGFIIKCLLKWLNLRKYGERNAFRTNFYTGALASFMASAFVKWPLLPTFILFFIAYFILHFAIIRSELK